MMIVLRYSQDTMLKSSRTTMFITGKHEPNGLWSISFLPPVHQANAILRLDKTSTELANYHYASLGSLAESTLIQAIHLGHLITFSGLTTKLISKHLTPSIATTLGHQDQAQMNLWSTQKPLTPEPTIHHADHDLAPPNEPCSSIICSKLLPSESLQSYSDQTGKFPIKSSRGNLFIFILYHYDTNTIHAMPWLK